MTRSRRRSGGSLPPRSESLREGLLRDVWRDLLGQALRQIEDRRLFHPVAGGLRPPAAVPRASGRLVPARPARAVAGYSSSYGSPRLAFSVPSDVVVCVKRQRRREVIHALGLRGKGAGSKSRRFNELSSIHCTRKGR